MKKIITKKFLPAILFVILVSSAAFAQNDEHAKYIQAIINGDTALAIQIEKRNIAVEPIEQKPLPKRNIPEHFFLFNINQLRDTIAGLFNFENQYGNIFLKSVFYNYMSKDEQSE